MEKLELELLVLCDQAVISREGKLSIIGIFDQIYAENIPATHSKMSVVGVVKGEINSDHTLHLFVSDPAGKELLPNQEIKINLGPGGRTNLVSEFINFPIPLTGIYKIELREDKFLLGQRELTVNRVGGSSHGAGSKVSGRVSN